MGTSAFTPGSSRRRVISPAPSRSRGASPRPSTPSPPPAGERSSAISITWKRSFVPRVSDERHIFGNDMSRTSAVTPSPALGGGGLHVGIIMDGNGRWAAARGLPRSAGHHAGVRAARAIVEAAVRAEIGTLTLYAFSSDNWSRPTPEVSALMRLLRRSLHTESKRCLENGVRLTIVGRRDRLPTALRAAIADAEALTARCRNLHLRVAIDYSSRDGILLAAERYAQQVARGAAADSVTRE